VIGIDAEFVAVEMEQAVVQKDGSRVVAREARQALARCSIIDDRTGASACRPYPLSLTTDSVWANLTQAW
jgi:hypothetical protein